MPGFWLWISAIALILSALHLLTSATVFAGISRRLIPILAETRAQIQDLGDLAANTVGRASDTMDLVEGRVSQAMDQAALAGKDATKQALGVGSALAGLYMAARMVKVLRSHFSHRRRH